MTELIGSGRIRVKSRIAIEHHSVITKPHRQRAFRSGENVGRHDQVGHMKEGRRTCHFPCACPDCRAERSPSVQHRWWIPQR